MIGFVWRYSLDNDDLKLVEKSKAVLITIGVYWTGWVDPITFNTFIHSFSVNALSLPGLLWFK